MDIVVSKPGASEKIIPVVPLREGVVFPHTEAVLTFGRPKSNAGVAAAFKGDRQIVFVSQKDSRVQLPNREDLYDIGTLCQIERILTTDGEIHTLVKGLSRVMVEDFVSTEPYFTGKVKILEEVIEDSNEMKAASNHLVSEFRKAVNLGKSVDFMMFMKLMSGVEANELVDQIAYSLDMKTEEKQKLLETLSVWERTKLVLKYLSQEINVLELEKSIENKTHAKFEKQMRDAMLRERRKIIDRELGEESDPADQEMLELRDKIKKAGMPLDVRKKAEKELNRLTQMSPSNPESGYLRTYLDWLTSMPWAKQSRSNISLAKSSEILDQDHYALGKVKERIVEFLAVMKLKRKISDKNKTEKSQETGPTILCFVGPPGVGKTSIGKSIARSLGRKFVRVSLGGIRDEAEIRGHRRTYVGALPGRIIQGIKNAGARNPVFMLDEIDKVGADFRGDPSSALLEALDPEQNKEFSDHYLEVPFDLSQVMFIATANVLDTIPPALRDRLEIIRFAGYTEEDKFFIAKNHLWQKQVRGHGLGDQKLDISDDALYFVIRRYTREAGVRELDRNIATMMRKVARIIASRKQLNKTISVDDVRKFLGIPKYSTNFAEKRDEIGMTTGLAWTEAGGDILFIEVVIMPGKGNLLLTGQLGDVMKESGQAAWSYVRSKWKSLGLKERFYRTIDIHVHVPEGAVPKDGPSAGIALTTAIVSALTKRPVRKDVAMTGEVTLRGRVLEIGGLKEKVIAAHRAGIKTVIAPKENRKDLEEIPQRVRKDLEFKFLSHMDEVLKVATLPAKASKVKKKLDREEIVPVRPHAVMRAEKD